MDGWSEPVSGSLMVAQTVVSVGPYALIRRRPEPHRRTASAGIASPATARVRTVASPSGGSTDSATGGRVTWVTRCRAISPASGRPGSSSSLVASTSSAPDSSAMHSSEKAASKLGEANCSTRSAAPTWNRSI